MVDAGGRVDQAGLTRCVLWLGPVNTLADLVAFGILLHITGDHPASAAQALFHTGWFVENLLTQAAAVHLLRSRRPPSLRDHAALPVLLGTAAIVAIAMTLPWSPLAGPLGMTALPGLPAVIEPRTRPLLRSHRRGQDPVAQNRRPLLAVLAVRSGGPHPGEWGNYAYIQRKAGRSRL